LLRPDTIEFEPGAVVASVAVLPAILLGAVEGLAHSSLSSG
jgi:hypothetical protein